MDAFFFRRISLKKASSAKKVDGIHDFFMGGEGAKVGRKKRGGLRENKRENEWVWKRRKTYETVVRFMILHP